MTYLRESNEIESTSDELFSKIRGQFPSISLGDENAKVTSDPEQARFFNFNFEIDGEDYGNVTISLIDNSILKVIYSRNISEELIPEHKKAWYDFLRSIRQFAARKMLEFEVRDITKDRLTPADYKFIQKYEGDYDNMSDTVVSEGFSKKFGSSKSTYQTLNNTKLIFRHTGKVDEEKLGSRSRNIKEIFVENHRGERFKLEFTNSQAARAMARHVAEGGTTYDDFGDHINQLVEEFSALGKFVKFSRNKTFATEEAEQMKEAGYARFKEIKETFKKIAGSRGYNQYKESWNTDRPIVEDDTPDLSTKFMKNVFEDGLDEVMPIVYRAWQSRQVQEQEHEQSFSEWADTVAEGTWAWPDTDEKIIQVEELFAEPIAVGPDASNIQLVLGDHIGDDSLYDYLYDIFDEMGPDTDAREHVIEWLTDRGEDDLVDRLTSVMQSEDSEESEIDIEMDDEMNIDDALGEGPYDNEPGEWEQRQMEDAWVAGMKKATELATQFANPKNFDMHLATRTSSGPEELQTPEDIEAYTNQFIDDLIPEIRDWAYSDEFHGAFEEDEPEFRAKMAEIIRPALERYAAGEDMLASENLDTLTALAGIQEAPQDETMGSEESEYMEQPISMILEKIANEFSSKTGRHFVVDYPEIYSDGFGSELSIDDSEVIVVVRIDWDDGSGSYEKPSVKAKIKHPNGYQKLFNYRTELNDRTIGKLITDKHVQELQNFIGSQETNESGYDDELNEIGALAGLARGAAGRAAGKAAAGIASSAKKFWKGTPEENQPAKTRYAKKLMKKGMDRIRASAEADKKYESSVNEISQDSKDRYVKKASSEHQMAQTGARNAHDHEKPYWERKARNRKKGISRALKK